MPVITIDVDDLMMLVGGEVTIEQVKNALPLNKIEIEEWNDKEAKVEITHDRLDLLSVEGIARQIRSWLGINTGLIKYSVAEPRVVLRASKVALRPYIVCGTVRGIKMDDRLVRSLMQLQEAIDLTIGRDRSKVAIGVHDLSKVESPFYYKETGLDDIRFVPLGFSKEMSIREIIREHPKGIEYAHLVRAKRVPIIVDRNGDVLSFPPIINGELTKVTENTRDIFFDITGTDFAAINYALNILTTALYERGGRIEGVKIEGAIKDIFPQLEPEIRDIKIDEIDEVIGVGIKREEIKSLLERMGYGVMEIGKDSMKVLIPPYRADILHNIDIIEDVAIAYGYNDIKSVLPKIPTSGGEESEKERITNIIRDVMVGLGFQEVVNFTLTSKEKQTTMVNIKDNKLIELENPISREYNVCRKTLFPLLLETLSHNKHRRFPQKIFEIGDCIIYDESSDVATRNVRKIAATISHSKANLAEIISIVNAFSSSLGLRITLKNCEMKTFIKGRCALIYKGNNLIGFLGEIHPEVLERFELEKPVTIFEIDAEEAGLW